MTAAKKPPAPLVKCDHAGKFECCKGCGGNRQHRAVPSCVVLSTCFIAGAKIRCVEVVK